MNESNGRNSVFHCSYLLSCPGSLAIVSMFASLQEVAIESIWNVPTFYTLRCTGCLWSWTRTDFRQQSNVVECYPKLFDRCSRSSTGIRLPKPSGLGMVSTFTASAARTVIGPVLRIDACRVGSLSHNYLRWLCSARAWRSSLALWSTWSKLPLVAVHLHPEFEQR